MSTPTPGKWKLLKGFKCTNIVDMDGEEIGYIIDPDHAAMTVRAVNTHAQLLEALKAVRRIIAHNAPAEHHVITLCDAAIAQAEGKE
jgi:hypothetical protein